MQKTISLNTATLSLFVIRAGVVGLQSASFFVIAKLFGVEVLGQFSFIFASSRICSVVYSMGGPAYLLRELSFCKADGEVNYFVRYLNKMLRSTLVFILAIGVYLLISLQNRTVADYSGGVLSVLEAIIFSNLSWLVILVFAYIISAMDITISLVRNLRSSTLSMFLSDFLPYFVFVIIIAVYSEFATGSGLRVAIFLMFGFFISFSVSFLISVIALSKFGKAGFRMTMIKDSKRSYFSFWGGAAAGVCMAQADIVIAKYFLSEVELGVYSLFRKVSNLICLPQVIANWMLSTKIATSFRKADKKELSSLAKRGLDIAVPVSVTIFFLFLVTVPVWFSLLQVPLTWLTVIALSVLMFSQLFDVLSGVNVLFANQCNEEQYVLKIRLTAFVVGSLGMVFGAYWGGIVGMASGISISILLVNILVSNHVKKIVDVWTPVMPLRRPLK